jgi:hypothetical protein
MSMATVTRRFAATPPEVWEVLCDGWRYSNWVVGTSHMRAVDSAWPAPGTRLEHATGIWPFVLRDSTEVVESAEPTHLALIAHGGALGSARIDIDVVATGDGSEVTIVENPVSGPGKWTNSPLTEAVIRRRNVETLGRLAALSERRTPPAPH